MRITADDLKGAAVFARFRQKLAKRGIGWPPRPEGRPLHFLYVSVPGNWERHNIPPQLETLGEVTTYFLKDRGFPCHQNGAETRRRVDAELPEFVQELHKIKPIDLMLSYLSGAQVSAQTIRAIGSLGIPTFNFHLDDRVSFRGAKIVGQWSGAADICAAFDLNLTNATDSVIKYLVEGGEAVFWPEGANPAHFRPLDLPFEYDVSFIGQRYGIRPEFISTLRRRGIQVACFGAGWEHGYVAEEKMVEIYAKSRINLGFGFISRGQEQCLKGRDFEVPMCGALYLTSHHPDLECVWRVGEEIATYHDIEDCARKIKALLADPDRCARMRAAARQGALSRHTWAARIGSLLECNPMDSVVI